VKQKLHLKLRDNSSALSNSRRVKDKDLEQNLSKTTTKCWDMAQEPGKMTE
jgi:hypothetical protein